LEIPPQYFLFFNSFSAYFFLKLNQYLKMKNSLFLLFLCFISCNNSPLNNAQKQLKEWTLIEQLKILDMPLKKAEKGDWLFEHKELEQTFEAYQKLLPIKPNDTLNTIYIQPIGVFNSAQNQIINATSDYLSLFFNVKTIVLNPILETEIPIKNRRIKDGIEQLNTKYILDTVLNKMPKNAIVSMAITAKDLYPNDAWNYVFGEANIQKRRAVSSIFRYNTEGVLDTTICLERLIKTSAHEIGHAFSCLHCVQNQCVMNGSNSLEESDKAPNSLCSNCLKKLSTHLLFDNKKRLNRLKDFYAKYHLNRDFNSVSILLNKLTTDGTD
jgi:archaemetzincin